MRALVNELQQAHNRHRERYMVASEQLKSAINQRIENDLAQILAFLIDDPKLQRINANCHQALRDQLHPPAQEIAELCDLMLPLNRFSIVAFSLAAIASAAFHLAMDDCLAYACLGRISGHNQPFSGLFADWGMERQELAAVTSMLAMAVFNAVIERLHRLHLRREAQITLRFGQQLWAQTTALWMAGGQPGNKTVHSNLERLVLANQMMPLRIMTAQTPSSIRKPLIVALSRLWSIRFELQFPMMNTAPCHAATPDAEDTGLIHKLTAVWDLAATLPIEICDAFAGPCLETVRATQERSGN